MSFVRTILARILLICCGVAAVSYQPGYAQSLSLDSIPGFRETAPLLQSPIIDHGLFDAEKFNRILELSETTPSPVCCQLDDGLPYYNFKSANECASHLIVSDELCRAKPFDCCCLDDDGPGTEGTWGPKSSCSRALCNVNVLVDVEAGICRVPLPEERQPRLQPSSFTIGLAQRLEKLGQKLAPGLGSSGQALCDASKLKPGEPCFDVTQCTLAASGFVECRQCATKGGQTCGDWSCSKKPDGTKGLCARACMPAPRVCRKAPSPVKYRNSASCHFKAENQTDASAKKFYDLSNGNRDAHNKMVRVMNAVSAYTKYIDGQEAFLIAAINAGTRPNQCPDKFDDGKGGTITKHVDCDKLKNSKCLFDDAYIFSQAAFSIKDVTMKKHVQDFLEGVMVYININLITDLGDLTNNPQAGKQEIKKRKDAFNALLNHVNNVMRPYVQSNP